MCFVVVVVCNDVFKCYYQEIAYFFYRLYICIYIYTRKHLLFLPMLWTKTKKIKKKKCVNESCLFFFFLVLGKHHQVMPICRKLRHRLYVQNAKTYKWKWEKINNLQFFFLAYRNCLQFLPFGEIIKYM